MKKLFLAFSIFLFGAGAFGQGTPTNVTKVGGSGSNKNDLTAQINVPSGQTMGMNGTMSGTGVWDFSGGTVHLPGSIGTVTSVGVTAPTVFSVTGSPITGAGTITINWATGQTANEILASPNGTTGAVGLRALVGADLPLPGPSSLGGMESITSAAHNWIAYIDTSGVPHQSQPAFTDISGVAAAAQLPNPGPSSLGGTESLAPVSHQWINSISTLGVPVGSQPGFADISGTLATGSQLDHNSITVAGNSTALGGSVTLDQILNSIGSTAQGDIIYYNGTDWTRLGASTAGFVLATQGPGANPHWTAVSGTGTVTEVDTTDGTLTGGPITTSGALAVNLAHANTWTSGQSYNSGDFLLKGSSSGSTTINASATASGIITFPAVTDTVALLAATQTLTGKTYDTVGTGNIFKINGAQVSSLGSGLGISGGVLSATGTVPGANTLSVNQTAHGFSVGQAVYNANGTWTLSKANALSTSIVHGVVTTVTDANNFVVTLGGAATLSGLTTNSIYYLSDATAGLLTTTAPTSTTSYLVQVMTTGTTSASFVEISSPASLALLSASTGLTGIVPSANGGTGVNNGSFTVTLGGNLNTAGAFNSTFTMTGNTNVTFPTSGTLSTTTGTVTSVGTTGGLTGGPITASGSLSLDLTYSPTMTGIWTHSPTARTSGSAAYWVLNIPTDTGLATATESIGANFAAGTRTWVDGTVTTQRERYFGPPTYNKTTTSATFTSAGNVVSGGAPIAGSGVTITNPYSFWSQSGNSGFEADNIGTTAAPTVTLFNPTAAAAGAQQQSPSTVWSGQGWAVTGSLNQKDAFQAFVLPVQSAGSTTTALWHLQSSINGGAYSDVFTVDNSGNGSFVGKISSSGNGSFASTIGAQTNTTRGSGQVGQIITATLGSGSAVSLTTATSANVTSISLTAGNWWVYGSVDYTTTSATVTQWDGGGSTTSATLGGQDTFFQVPFGITTLSVTDYSNPIPLIHLSLSVTTPVYLVAQSTFSAGSVSAYGTISAFRSD